MSFSLHAFDWRKPVRQGMVETGEFDFIHNFLVVGGGPSVDRDRLLRPRVLSLP